MHAFLSALAQLRPAQPVRGHAEAVHTVRPQICQPTVHCRKRCKYANHCKLWLYQHLFESSYVAVKYVREEDQRHLHTAATV